MDSPTLSFIFVFIFGTILGSFLNVAILRYGTGLGVVTKGSFCFSCKRRLSPSDLIPVLSYVFLGGKCRTCRHPLSPQYPIVEVIMGAILVGIFAKIGVENIGAILLVSVATIFFCLLIVISVYDLYHKIIPDPLVFVLSLVGLFSIFVTDGADIFRIPSTEAFTSGPMYALPFALLWFASGGRAMGLGDAKLMLAIGWFLGQTGGFSALVLAFWIGAIVSILFMILLRVVKRIRKSFSSLGWEKLTFRTEVPFGPFLAIGCTLVYFFGINIMKIHQMAFFTDFFFLQ